VDDTTRDRLRKYLQDVKGLPNESAKTHRFVGLLGELFPGFGAVTKFTEGTEKLVHSSSSTGQNVRRIMDRFFSILSEGVHRFEGTINQYTGDGIMALFGAPIAHEDHAQRAVALARGAGIRGDLAVVAELLPYLRPHLGRIGFALGLLASGAARGGANFGTTVRCIPPTTMGAKSRWKSVSSPSSTLLLLPLPVRRPLFGRRDNRCVPPPPGSKPRRTSPRPNRAC
jgi:hypothetical protein